MTIILLDAGHGISTPGKRTPDDIREWTLNNSVAVKVENNLKQYKDVQVYRTDDVTGKEDISLAERMRREKKYKASLFLSIHHNALNGVFGDQTGVESFCHPSDAGSKELNKLFAEALSRHTGLKNRGAKETAYYVLANCSSSVPAILTEGGFMDGRKDHPIITSSKGQQQYADALTEVIVKYFKLVKKDQTTSQPTTNTGNANGGTTFYRVIAGSNTVRTSTESQVAKLKSQGYKDAFLAIFDNPKDGKRYYRSVVASMSVRQNAVNLENELKGKGYSAFLEAFVK